MINTIVINNKCYKFVRVIDINTIEVQDYDITYYYNIEKNTLEEEFS